MQATLPVVSVLDLQGAIVVGMLAVVVDKGFERLARRVAWAH